MLRLTIRVVLGLAVLPTLIIRAPLRADTPGDAVNAAATWDFQRLDVVGEHKTTLLGSPRLIDTPDGKAGEFDGKGDAIFLDSNALAGLREFTVEVIFRPYAGGPKEQRFLHFQETGSENRLLFEIRLSEESWFLDTFIRSGVGNYTLYAEKSPHAVGPWYHAAVVVDGSTMRHYVNGREELSTPIKFEPLKPGQASIGVRINKVSWFRGAVRRIRISPNVLTPQEFMRP
jgi:Concanavalin A-like lectin/glucanases superfamily